MPSAWLSRGRQSAPGQIGKITADIGEGAQAVLDPTIDAVEGIGTIGAAFAALTFVVKGPVGFGAGVLSGWLRARPTVIGWINRASGVVLVGLGLRLALERRG